MSSTELPFDPREFVRQYTNRYVNLHVRWTKFEKPPKDVRLSTPADTPISAANLPDQARALLQEFQAQRPRAKIEFVKHLRTVNGKAVQLVEDDQGLPPEDE